MIEMCVFNSLITDSETRNRQSSQMRLIFSQSIPVICKLTGISNALGMLPKALALCPGPSGVLQFLPPSSFW